MSVPPSSIVPVLICCFSLAIGLSWSRAAAPSNDECQDAFVVPSDAVFPWLSPIVADINTATNVGIPGVSELLMCGDFPYLVEDLSRSLWYQFTPAETAVYRLSVHRDSATTVDDTLMAVFTSANGCVGPFTELDCNDDTGLDFDNALKSAVARTLNAGTTYYVVVWLNGDYELEPGMTAVQLRISKPEAPANDQCASAIVIPGNASFPYLTATVDSLLATEVNDPAPPTCRLRPFVRRSLWYEFTPATTSTYTITTCQGTETRVFDTVMGLYTSPNGCGGPFVEVSCNDRGCGDRAEISQLLMAGTKYYIVVWDTELEAQVAETEVQLRVALPPAAITLPATSLTSTSAVLHGVVRANSTRRTWYYFEWGTDTNYTMPRTDLEFLFMGSLVDLPYAFNLGGLTPNLPYHYRLVVTNNASEIAYGVDQTFLWNATPPLLTNLLVPPTSEGSFQFQFSGQPNQIYQVESSTNLLQWSYLGPASNVGNGTFSFLDTNAPPLPKRFYRLLAP